MLAVHPATQLTPFVEVQLGSLSIGYPRLPLPHYPSLSNGRLIRRTFADDA